MTKNTKGTLCVVLAAIAWGLSGVSGQFLMLRGVDVHLLTALRSLVSGLLLLGIVVLRDPAKLRQLLKDRQSLRGILCFSLLGLCLNQYAYLQAIQHTNAGTATVLQYMAPIIILMFLCLKNRVLPTLFEVFAVILAILGTFIMATHGQLGGLAMTPQGFVWGIFSAFTYSVYILLPVPLIKKWGSLPVIGLGMLMGGSVFGLSFRVWQYDVKWGPETVLAYLGLILIGSVFAYTFFLKGTTLVGAVKGSLLASIEPVAAVIFAVFLIHERFYFIDFLGMALIFLAVLCISLKDFLSLKKKKLNQ